MRSAPQNLIKRKVDLLNLAAEFRNASRACKVNGFPRDRFYRYQPALETGGVDALIDANRRRPNLRNRIKETTEVAVAQFAPEQPVFSQVRESNELHKRIFFRHPMHGPSGSCFIERSDCVSPPQANKRYLALQH